MEGKGSLTPTSMRGNCRPTWLSGRSPQYLAAIVVNLIAFSFGTVVGWASVAGPVLQEAGYSEEGLSWSAALVFLGSIIGACLCAMIAEWKGRRWASLLTAAPLILGWIGLLGDWGLVVLLASRLIGGIGCGGALVASPMYVGEVVDDSVRGFLCSLMPLFLNAGILFSYVVGAQVSLSMMSIICALIPVTFVLLFVWFPETPSYLVSRGDETGALEALAWLRDPRQADVLEELNTLKATLKRGEAEVAAGTMRDLFATRSARRGVLCVSGLLAAQQLSGIGAIISYAASIFQSAGSSLDPNTAACVVGALQLLGSMVSTVLVDRTGRLLLLYASYGPMTVTLATLGVCFFWPDAVPGWLPVLSLSVYIFTYALGSGPIPYVLLAEVFPSRLRSAASMFNLVVVFFICFLVTKFFGQISAALGAHGCFWLFSACCLLTIVFTKFAVPETKGKSVEKIIAELEGDGTSSEHSMSELHPETV